MCQSANTRQARSFSAALDPAGRQRDRRRTRLTILPSLSTSKLVSSRRSTRSASPLLITFQTSSRTFLGSVLVGRRKRVVKVLSE